MKRQYDLGWRRHDNELEVSMKTNEAMSVLLLKTTPSGASNINDYTNFVEWDGCILISNFAKDLPSSFDKTTYSDRTDCEASINHLHSENLSMALGCPILPNSIEI